MNVGPQGLPATTLWGLLAAAWPAPFHTPPPRSVHQPPPCHKSSLPQPPISVPPTGLDESLWSSDFHTVQFSVSSGCFLFVNCCCPSFGCARRHSVSTYASILAGSQGHDFLISFLSSSKDIFFTAFREGRRERGRERKKNINVIERSINW